MTPTNNQAARRLAVAAVVLGSIYLAFAAVHVARNAQSASANTVPASIFSVLSTPGGETFRNWDFVTTVDARDQVDWPIRFLFRDDAEIDKVKHRVDGIGSDPFISPVLDAGGSTKYHYFNHEGSWEWDADSGIKQGLLCITDHHMRFYADSSSDRNGYDTGWGYYLFGTLHEDDEGWACADEWESLEEDEDWWRTRIEGALENGTYGWNVSDSVTDFDNALGTDGSPVSIDGGSNHWLSSDGRPVYVDVDQ